MAGLGIGEFIGIIILAIVVYGKELPQVARKLAYWYSKVRRQLTDIKDEFHRQVPLDDLDLNKHMDSAYPEGERPVAPEGIQAVAGDGVITLSWEPCDDATGYLVKRTTDPSDTSTTIASNVSGTRYDDYEVRPGVEYTYMVAACNKAGEGDDSIDVSATLPADKPLATTPASA